MCGLRQTATPQTSRIKDGRLRPLPLCGGRAWSANSLEFTSNASRLFARAERGALVAFSLGRSPASVLYESRSQGRLSMEYKRIDSSAAHSASVACSGAFGPHFV